MSLSRPTLRHDVRGLSAVEYVLVVIGIAIVGLLAWTFFGEAAVGTTNDATVAIQTMEGWSVDARGGGEGSGSGDGSGSRGRGSSGDGVGASGRGGIGASSGGSSGGWSSGGSSSGGSSSGSSSGGWSSGGSSSGGSSLGGSGPSGGGPSSGGPSSGGPSSGGPSSASASRSTASSAIGFGRGVVEGFVGVGWDTVTGVAGLAVSTVRGVGWVATHPGEAASNVGSAVTYAAKNPGEVARSAGDLGKAVVVSGVNAAKEAVRVVREGTPEERGKLVGAIAFEVATTVGTGGAGQASKLRHADKVADGLRAADRVGDAARTADRAGDVARSADRAGDVARSADGASDAARSADRASDAARSADRARDAARSADRGDLVAVVGRRSDDTADAARSSDYVVDATCTGGVCRRPGSCFAAGTSVRTNEGFVPIEQVRVGDVVQARHEKTGELGLFPVIDTIVREDEPLLAVTVGRDVTETIRVTPEHPFHTARGWVAAKELTPDDRIARRDGSYTEVVALEALPIRTRVFNLTVDEAHTYFVGDAELWVHNACRRDLNPARRPARPGNVHDGWLDANGRVDDARLRAQAERVSKQVNCRRIASGNCGAISTHRGTEVLRHPPNDLPDEALRPVRPGLPDRELPVEVGNTRDNGSLREVFDRAPNGSVGEVYTTRGYRGDVPEGIRNNNPRDTSHSVNYVKDREGNVRIVDFQRGEVYDLDEASRRFPSGFDGTTRVRTDNTRWPSSAEQPQWLDHRETRAP
ncbi:MAG: Hint domain-containing protein [Sandaracinus sp.]|nr:Hint domain-containing protein [Sandaracinus sp.]MCB9630672.1 Hint domain-containing protein [Sandaracinus sp.]